jgi:hypothetical protein
MGLPSCRARARASGVQVHHHTGFVACWRR